MPRAVCHLVCVGVAAGSMASATLPGWSERAEQEPDLAEDDFSFVVVGADVDRDQVIQFWGKGRKVWPRRCRLLEFSERAHLQCCISPAHLLKLLWVKADCSCHS